MPFTITVNGNEYTSDPNNTSAPPGNRFIGYGYITALANLAVDIVSVLTQKSSEAAASAATAVNAPGTSATSTTSLTVGTGAKALTIQTGKLIALGMSVKIANTAAPTNWMAGDVTAYNSATGALNVNVTRVAGAGTATTWTVSLAGAPGVDSGVTTVTATATGTTVLTAATIGYVPLQMPGIGYAIQMPSAIGLPIGGPRVVLDNTQGDHPAGVLDGAGNCLGQVLPGEAVVGWLKDVSTVAGVWMFDGNMDPWWQTADLPITPYGSASTLFKIDENRSLFFSQNASTYPVAYYVSHPADGSLSIGAAYVLGTSVGNVTNVTDLGGSRVLVQVTASSFVVIDYSAGATLAVSVSPAAHGLSGLAARHNLDGRYVMLFGCYGGNVEAACLDCGATGTAIAVGARITSTFGYAGGGVTMLNSYTVNSTVVGVLCMNSDAGATYYQYFLNSITRTSGTTVAFGVAAGQPPSLYASGYIQNVNGAVQVAGAVWLLHYNKTTASNTACIALTFASACTWGAPVDTGLTIIGSAQKPAKVGATSFLIAANQAAGGKLQALSVGGATITMGSPVVFDSASDQGGAYVNTQLIVPSALDGRGLVAYSVNSGIRQYAGWTVSGSTVLMGSKFASKNANSAPFGATNFDFSIAEGTTALRFVLATGSGSLSGSIATLSIDAAGNLALGGWMNFTSGQAVPAVQPAGLSSGRAILTNQLFSQPTHGVFVGGRWKVGYGWGVMSQLPAQQIQSGTGALNVLANDRRLDRTQTMYRIRFAER